MEANVFKNSETIFRERDPGDCMYFIQKGSVGIFRNHGTPEEIKLAELKAGDYFGEMSLLNHEPRSATAVAMEDLELNVVSEDAFPYFIQEHPEAALSLGKQMSSRLRQTTRDYVEACRTVYETVDARDKGKSKSENLLSRIRKFCAVHLGSGNQPGRA